jgi:hypothetical protein
VTRGRRPAAPGGTPRGSDGDRLGSRHQRPAGEPAIDTIEPVIEPAEEITEEIVDIGEIRRTEELLNALARGHAGPGGTGPAEAPAGSAAGGTGAATGTSGPAAGDAGSGEPDERRAYEPAVAALAALAADVRAGAGAPGDQDVLRDDGFRRRVHAACGQDRGWANMGAATPGGGRPPRRTGMRAAVTAAAAAAAVATSGVAAAGLHGRLLWLAGGARRAAAPTAQAPREAKQRIGEGHAVPGGLPGRGAAGTASGLAGGKSPGRSDMAEQQGASHRRGGDAAEATSPPDLASGAGGYGGPGAGGYGGPGAGGYGGGVPVAGPADRVIGAQAAGQAAASPTGEGNSGPSLGRSLAPVRAQRNAATPGTGPTGGPGTSAGPSGSGGPAPMGPQPRASAASGPPSRASAASRPHSRIRASSGPSPGTSPSRVPTVIWGSGGTRPHASAAGH